MPPPNPLGGSSLGWFLGYRFCFTSPEIEQVYKRVGTSIRKCSEDEILRMIMDSRAYDYESDVSENQDLTFRFLNKFCDEQDIELSDKQMVTPGLKKQMASSQTSACSFRMSRLYASRSPNMTTR